MKTRIRPKNAEMEAVQLVHISHQLAGFFDLLAKFDYEDKQKEKPAAEAGSLSEASPRESVSETESGAGKNCGRITQ